MLENTIYVGINAPREHQAVISRLIYELVYLNRQKLIALFPYPETMIDAGQTSPAPDILLVDPETDLTKIMIEITHTQGVKKDLIKVRNLMKDYDVPEGFVYDYKKNKWYRVSPPLFETEEDNAYSAILHRDLRELLL